MLSKVFATLFLCFHIALCWVNVNKELRGRIIHVETLRYRGRWLDAHHSKKAFFTGSPEREVFYKTWTQFKVSEANGNYVTLESIRYPHHYVDAHHSGRLHITYSNYPKDKVWAKWWIECTNKAMDVCRVKTPRYNNYIDAHHSGEARLAKYGHWSLVRILAPRPEEYFRTLLDTENESSVDQKKTVTMFEGVSNTVTRSKTVTTSMSLEIGAAFKAFSASASSSLTTEWQRVSSKTFQSQTTVTYDIVIPAKKRIIFKQLNGKYGPFSIAARRFQIKELPLVA